MGRILKDSGLFWATLGYLGVFWVIGMFFDDLGRLLLGAACLFACFCMLLLAVACFCLLLVASAHYCLLSSWVCTMECGTHFELEL